MHSDKKNMLLPSSGQQRLWPDCMDGCRGFYLRAVLSEPGGGGGKEFIPPCKIDEGGICPVCKKKKKKKKKQGILSTYTKMSRGILSEGDFVHIPWNNHHVNINFCIKSVFKKLVNSFLFKQLNIAGNFPLGWLKNCKCVQY